MRKVISAHSMQPGVYRHKLGAPLVWFHKSDDGTWQRKDLMGQDVRHEGDAAPTDDILDALIRIA